MWSWVHYFTFLCLRFLIIKSWRLMRWLRFLSALKSVILWLAVKATETSDRFEFWPFGKFPSTRNHFPGAGWHTTLILIQLSVDPNVLLRLHNHLWSTWMVCEGFPQSYCIQWFANDSLKDSAELAGTEAEIPPEGNSLNTAFRVLAAWHRRYIFKCPNINKFVIMLNEGMAPTLWE